MESPRKRRLLFLHSSGSTQRRTRSRALDSKIRRHLMIDIGRGRRKKSNSEEYVTLVWAADVSNAQSKSRHSKDKSWASGYTTPDSARTSVIPSTNAYIAVPPALQALAGFETNCGEDKFSAYGFSLILVMGRHATASCRNLQSMSVEAHEICNSLVFESSSPCRSVLVSFRLHGVSLSSSLQADIRVA
jgi:hypothetical protein